MVRSIHRRQKKRRRLCFESLEDRRLLAQFSVTNLNDSGAGSLRDAVEQANADAAVDEIVFQSGLAGTISLTSGQLVVTRPLTVTGPGAAKLTIDAQQNSRIFDVSFGSFDVNISGVTLTGGRAASGDGGAIRSNSSGTLTLADAVISGNTASDDGGGVSIVAGPLTVTASTISGNEAKDTGGGIVTRSGQVTVTDSTISGNSAGEEGGGISSVFGTVTVTRSTVSGNTADYGGGISTRYGQVTATCSTISGNSANEGGGIYTDSASVTATSSTISANSAYYGGGVFANSAPLDIYNSTISGNSADQDGGGIFVHDSAINPPLTIQSSIIAGNAAVDQGPDVRHDPEAMLTIGHSLIGDNSDTALSEAQTPDASGNLVGDPNGLGAIDPLLLPIAFNGGSTQTHALRPDSPAINIGAAGDQTTDQRGGPRDDGNGVDMGAFELGRHFIVDTVDDGDDAIPGDGLCEGIAGTCSLRAALQEANAWPNADPNAPDMIFFDIAGVAAPAHTIRPGTPLPAIADAVIIDATSEPDFDLATGNPVIEVDGTLAGANASGLIVIAGGAGSTIRGLAVNHFGSGGVLIANADGVVLEGNYIGTDPLGTTARANARGVVLSGATNTTIGGTTAEAGNTISGNSGIGILMTAGSNNNTVQGNRIGVAGNGLGGLANGGTGIKIQGNSTGNTIGGVTTGAGNILSGNSGHGVFVSGSGTTGNAVMGNLIGTNATATAAIGNTQNGVFFSGAAGNTIGGVASGAGNAISGNSIGVLLIGNSTGTTVQGNAIGTNPTGVAPIPNRTGVVLSTASNAMIGGSVPGAGNLISGNTGVGVLLTASSNNTLEGNLVGTAIDGETPLPNGGTGLRLQVSSTNNMIGGAVEAGNTISGNGGHGVALANGGTTGNTIAGNQIGINRAGTAAVGNVQSGVFVSSAPGNTIGGTAAGASNTISGNSVHGILLTRTGTTNTVVVGNRIGSDTTGSSPVPNLVDGIFILNAPGNTIGGATPGAGNLITASGVHGVVVSGSVSTGNTISANSIFGNSLLGIDLDTAPADPGRTVNDAGDADTGPNNVQNFPVITAAVLGSGTLDVTFSVDSTTVNSAYDMTVEFFLADSQNGEGQTFLDAVTYTAANAGLAVMETITIPAGVTVNLGDQVLATATDAGGNTSEFSLSRMVAGPLTSAGGEASPETSVKSQELGMGDLLPIVDAAVARLAGLGFDASLLASIDVSIADLPGATLGLATGNSITIDINAAGYGWFIDATPYDDSEFNADSQLSTLDSRPRIDLLTVVMHELGHVVGLPDLYDVDDAEDLMYGWLEAGIRKTSLEASLADQAFAGF